MSTQEVIANAKALIEEVTTLESRKDEIKASLWKQRDEIDWALKELGSSPDAKPKKPRKGVSDEARQRMSAAQRRRHGKGGDLPSTETQTETN